LEFLRKSRVWSTCNMGFKVYIVVKTVVSLVLSFSCPRLQLPHAKRRVQILDDAKATD